MSPVRVQRGAFALAWVALGLSTLALTAQFIWLFTLSRDVAWDEGYLMITMRGFVEGHALYDEVFTQYGPTYYLLRAPIYLLLGVTLDHDSTRVLCMAAWVASAMLFSFGIWRSTRSIFLAWFSLLQGTVHLSTMANEPGHPQELVVMMQVGMFCLLASATVSPLAWILVAVLAALVITTKINVGLFVMAGLVALYFARSKVRTRGLGWLLSLMAIALPFALMRHHLDEFWALSYAVAAAAAIATVLAAMFSPTRAEIERPAFGIVGFVLAFLAVVGAVLASTMTLGTSAKGLLQGLVLGPLELVDAFSMPLDAAPWTPLSALASILCAACVLGRQRRGESSPTWIVGIKLSYAVLGSMALIGHPELQLLILGPWIWIALVSDRGTPGSSDQGVAVDVRLAVCAIGAFSLLQAYPVAGSQLAWATLLLIPTYVFCLHDGFRFLWRRTGALARAGEAMDGAPTPGIVASRVAPSRSTGRLRLVGVLGCLALLWTYANLWLDLPRLRQQDARAIPLGLSGSSLIRLPPEAVALYQSVTEYLKDQSDGFVSYPGYHSLYFWTGMRPPTNANVTVWALLSDAQQQEIVNQMRRFEQPRIVMTGDYLGQWKRESPGALRPFPAYVLAEYEPVGMIGPRIYLLAPKVAQH